MRALAITENSTLKKCDEFTARKTLAKLVVFVDNAVFGTDGKIKGSVYMMKKQEKKEERTLKTHHLLFLSILFPTLCKEFLKMQHGEKNNRYLSNLVWENFFFRKIITVVILGQHHVRLSDAALNNSFFSNMFYQNQFKYAIEHRGCSNLRCLFIGFFREKVPFYISAGSCLQFLITPE